ncbi:MAG: ferredoxin [Candidatus Aenigmarchaeota archaeon]|nr:ferredoxin [Candidatus Aenigmarchaeota archaeon]
MDLKLTQDLSEAFYINILILITYGVLMVRIDESKCIGCGVCESICPDGFEVVNGKAKVKNDKAPCIENAARSCPSGAIILDKFENNGVESSKSETRESFPTPHVYGPRYGRGIGRGMRKGRRRRGRW